MFERFSGEARQMVVFGQQEARHLHHDVMGTEHLLLGLLHLPGSDPAVAALTSRGLDLDGARETAVRLLRGSTGRIDTEALTTIGIDFDTVREKVEAAFGAGALNTPPARRDRRSRGGHVPLTGRAKKVLELSLREAVRTGSRRIEAGHVLLGLVREKEGLGARILRERGIDTVALRATVERSLRADER